MRSRWWIYVLSVAVLLGPAAGIAYLGAVSYRDERGAVAAQIDRQREAALLIADRLEQAISDALDEAERGIVRTPLAQHWFWIDADQHLRVPRPAPSTLAPTPAFDRGPSCEKLRATECAREEKLRRTRLAALQAGQQAETSGALAEAKKQYSLAAVPGAQTRADALLGLARVSARLGDIAGTRQALADLEIGYGDRVVEGVPLRVVAGILRAQGDPAALLAVAERVLSGDDKVDPLVRLGVIARLRRDLDGPLPAPLAARRADLDAQVLAIRSDARRAAALAIEIPDIAHTATAAWHGRPGLRDPKRTLLFRSRADGAGVIGIVADAALLEQAIADAPTDADIGQHVSALVLPASRVPEGSWRTIVQVPLGAALPHLNLALVNPITDPDPLDEVIRERSRRHVIYTSALAIALGLGLFAMIRGAVRARELARLKSDFVSTVSHELKTPLTSIRMFAEMLEQGVAQGDSAKMARYHGVIVQESQRLGLLIANLLDYAQIERGTRRYTPSRHELAQLARHAVTTFETLRDPEARDQHRNRIEVVVSGDVMHVEVDVDRDVIVQALLNLVSNAVKYGGDKPIEVTVGADATTAWVAVRDQGPGIPPGEQARIFREFYRAPDAYRAGVEGTGLGLALVKRHVEALGGTVEVASQVGHGATFTIRLPRAGDDV